MQTIRQIKQTIEESDSLKMVAQAYTEIATLKLQKIRSGIERNRNFFQEITSVYRIVKVAANKKGLSETSKNRGTISILLTSNQKFYGDLELRLIKFFAENSKKFPTDRLVIGTTAKEYLKATQFNEPYQIVVPSSDLPHLEEMRQLIAGITEYQQILVYYSRMQSILIQEPTVVNLLQKPPEHLLESKHTFEFIFEPEIRDILEFFNRQITLLLLEQTFLESELTRTAARLVSMDQAQANADNLIKGQKRMLAFAQRSLDNMRLLDTIASMTNWRKEHYAF